MFRNFPRRADKLDARGYTRLPTILFFELQTGRHGGGNFGTSSKSE